MAMYVIKEGTALYQATVEGTLLGVGERFLRAGDSFGEEIVMGYEGSYCYTITATSEVVAAVMNESEFLPLHEPAQHGDEAAGQLRAHRWGRPRR